MANDHHLPINPLVAKLRGDGPPAIGTFCSIPDTGSAEALGGTDLDFIFIDVEHGLPTMDSLVSLVPAISRGGTPALVRLPWNDPAQVMRALDLGAAGVIIPMVSTGEEAAAAAAACRYPPEGIRSFGQAQGTRYGDTDQTNRQVLCIVMIETATGLENLDEIASTPGVDGIFIGPIDLMLSMGRPIDFTLSDPEVVDALSAILDAGRRHDCPIGIPLFGIGMASAAVEAGYRFITTGSDAGYIRAGAAADLAALHAITTGDIA